MRGFVAFCLFASVLATPADLDDTLNSLVSGVGSLVSTLLATTTSASLSTGLSNSSSIVGTAVSTSSTLLSTGVAAISTGGTSVGTDVSTTTSAPYPLSNSTTPAPGTGTGTAGTVGTTSYTIVSSYPIYRNGSCFTMTNATAITPSGTAAGTGFDTGVATGTAATGTAVARRGYLYDHRHAKRDTTTVLDIPTSVLPSGQPDASSLSSATTLLKKKRSSVGPRTNLAVEN